MKDGIIGYGVVGLGRGRAHAAEAAKAHNCKLVAVCDIKPERADPVAEKYGCLALYDYAEMLKRDDIDVISIATPSGMHADMVVQAAEAGKHVLCEKPLDISLEKIDAAIAACRTHKVKLGCIFQNRFARANQAIKHAIDRGDLGKLYLGNMQVKWWRAQEYYNNSDWRGTWALDGGGSLMNQSVHTIDLFQWFFGPVESVFAKTAVYAHDIETEDAGLALVKFRSGALGTIIGTTAAYPGMDTTIQLHGENGSIYVTDNKIMNWRIRGEDEVEREQMMKAAYAGEGATASSDPDANIGVGFEGQVQDMVNAVLEDRDPLVPGQEARAAVEIILAIYQSARTGKEVFLPL